MATWNEIDQYLKAQGFAPSGETIWKRTLPTSDGRTQHLVISKVDLPDSDEYDMMWVSSAFSRLDVISLEQAAELTASAPFGLRVLEDFFALTNTLWIEDLDESELLKTITFVALWADKLELEISGNDNM